MANGTAPKSISFMPREHGAYAQLGISLLAALALVPLSGRAWAQGLGTVLVFLASEPFLVLQGRRGEAARIQGAREARCRIWMYCTLILLTLGLAWQGTPLHQGLSVLPGLVLGLFLLGLFLARREHSALGELLAAGAFALAALPVAILGGIPPGKAITMALGLAALNGLGTTLVRAFLVSQRHPTTRGAQVLPILLGLGLTLGTLASPLPRLMAVAAVPLTVVALWVMATPPSPKQLRTLGWVLTVGSGLGALTLAIAIS